MSIASQSLGRGNPQERKLQDLLADANDTRRKQLEKKIQIAVADAIKEPDLTAANVNSKIAAQLRIQIPEITQP